MSGFLTPLSMENFDSHVRLFEEMRLHPWIPEHKLFIDGQIAVLGVTDAARGKSFKKAYDEKMATYEAQQKAAEEEAIIPTDGDLTIADLQKVLDDKEKRLAKKEPAKEVKKPLKKKSKSSPK